jgi:hypothetical protein
MRKVSTIHQLQSSDSCSEYMVLRNHRNVGVVELPNDISPDESRRLLGEFLNRIGDQHPLRDATIVKRVGTLIVMNDPDMGFGDVAVAGGPDQSVDCEKSNRIIIEDVYADDIRGMSPKEILSLVYSGKLGKRSEIAMDISDGYIYMQLPEGMAIFESAAEKESAEASGDIENALTSEVLIGEGQDWIGFLFRRLGFGVSQ